MELLDDESTQWNARLSGLFGRFFASRVLDFLYRLRLVRTPIGLLQDIWDQRIGCLRTSRYGKRCGSAVLSQGFACVVRFKRFGDFLLDYLDLR